MTPIRRIVHPTDFSAAADPAFEAALAMARRESAELILVHVIEPVSVLRDELGHGHGRCAREAVETAARKAFDDLLVRAKEAAVPAADVLVDGWAPEEIVAVAAHCDADLIVMGTHGRTGLLRLFLGSVAQRVIATAPCPVLTVRM